MPSPVALASKEEEERRAWVTAHHEVVKLAKDCFGDRFSNNEIFDRLKISRRTGYRALGNDERIGKAPGRKPKILESTIKDMIDYIENGGCNDVGNVWKHLAEKFAPDCNPKTVQDAVKKSGFKNHRNTVKLEPLLNEHASEDQQGPEDEDQIQDLQLIAQEPQQQQPQQQPHHIQPQQHQNVIDPAFQQPSMIELLPSAIQNAPDSTIRFTLFEVCRNFHDAAQLAVSILNPYNPFQSPGASLAPMNPPHMLPSLQSVNGRSDSSLGKRPRMAICRRCNQQYDRAENTMDNRSCLYHKGSPQKIFSEASDSIDQSPEAYIWSCCGGNGIVRGCCRAMHTTKKKRKYGKKRSADEAGLDGDGDGEDTGDETNNNLSSITNITMAQPDASTTTTTTTTTTAAAAAAALEDEDQDPNIDARLQDLAPAAALSMHNLSMQMAAQMAAPAAVMHGHPHPHAHSHGHVLQHAHSHPRPHPHSHQHLQHQHGHHAALAEAMQDGNQVLPAEMQLQLAASMVGGNG